MRVIPYHTLKYKGYTSLKREASSAKIQEVATSLDRGFDEQQRLFFDEMNWNPEKIQEVCRINLRGCVEPHEDRSFIKQEQMSKRVLLVVTKVGVVPWKQGQGHDYMRQPIFMYDNTKFVELLPDYFYWFDASKTHAIFNDRLLQGFTVWWRK